MNINTNKKYYREVTVGITFCKIYLQMYSLKCAKETETWTWRKFSQKLSCKPKYVGWSLGWMLKKYEDLLFACWSAGTVLGIVLLTYVFYLL